MKYFFTFSILICLAINSSGQAAGNYYFNQKSKGGISYDSDYKLESENRSYNQSQTYPIYSAISDTTFTLEVSAIMNVKANEYVMILGTSQVGETLENCYELINKRIDGFKTALINLGIKKEDIFADYISQFPVFEIEVEKKLFSKTYHEIPSGYELKKNIHVHYKGNTLAEKIMLQAAKNEIYDIIKVDYIVDNQKAIYDTLRQACIEVIQTKVREYGNIGIVTTSDYELISENVNATYPLEKYSTYAEFARYSANSTKMGSKVISKYDVPALYYNPIPYNNYEIVINPVVIEPVVQFTYNVKVKYVLKKK